MHNNNNNNFLVKELPKNAEFIMSTNMQSPIQILGVGKLKLREGKNSDWRTGYVALYTDAGVRKKCEINEELFNALHLLYRSLDELGEERLFSAATCAFAASSDTKFITD